MLTIPLIRKRIGIHTAKISLLAGIACLLAAQVAQAREEIIYPQLDGFVIDVTSPPFNADPTGQVDSSEAILAASLHARTWPRRVPMFVYFPNGTYRIEQPVVLETRTPGGQYIMMQGQSRDGVVLYVPDNTPAFQNASAPRPMISYFDGDWTNNGFLNTFENFTIEIGAGNPGAIGVRFQGNNVARMSNVIIRSLDPDGVGAVGLDLSSSISAPGVVENVIIEGFDLGIKMDNTITSVYSWVLRDIEIYGQRVAGIRAHRKPVTIHGLTSVNSVPVFQGVFRDGNVVIFHADLSTPDGVAVDGPAIVGRGDFFYLRNVVQTGYEYLFDDNGTRVEATNANGSFRTGPVYKVWEDSPEDFLYLDEVEFPVIPWTAPEEWLVLEPAGVSDHTEMLREAFNSGAETIFLKPGVFVVSETVRIGPSVKRIASNYAQIQLGFPLTSAPGPVFELGVSDHPAVIIEQVWGNWQQNISNYFIHNRSNADLYLRDIFLDFRGRVPQRSIHRQAVCFQCAQRTGRTAV
ncbi:MAG: glycoside hydrolase family 55 protein [Verrucomicrobia bacterium]|nr:glycoside hydrolase family 55 protein [Verrucomicrobiota bacterium]